MLIWYVITGGLGIFVMAKGAQAKIDSKVIHLKGKRR